MKTVKKSASILQKKSFRSGLLKGIGGLALSPRGNTVKLYKYRHENDAMKRDMAAVGRDVTITIRKLTGIGRDGRTERISETRNLDSRRVASADAKSS